MYISIINFLHTSGDVEEAGIYNCCLNSDDVELYGPGTIMVIKEPWLKYGSQNKSPGLRIDSPSDIIVVDPTDLDFLNKVGAKKWCVHFHRLLLIFND